MTRRDLLSTVPGLVTANAVAFGLDGVAADHETAEVQARIQRVENGLRPEPLLRYSSIEAAALSDRMAAHKVPGLSISVIHDYKVEWVRNSEIIDCTVCTSSPATLVRSTPVIRQSWSLRLKRGCCFGAESAMGSDCCTGSNFILSGKHHVKAIDLSRKHCQALISGSRTI